MRSLTASEESTQKSSSIVPRYKAQIVLGGTDNTYEQDIILHIDHVERYTPHSHRATIVINNYDNALGTTDFRGFKVTLSFGMETSNGDEYSTVAPMWILDQEIVSEPGNITHTFFCGGLPDLLAQDHAAYEYNQEKDNTLTVKDLLTAVVTASSSLPFLHTVAYTATFDSEDQLMDTFVPLDAFSIPLNRSRMDVIDDLLVFTKSVMRVEDDGEVHFLVPKSEGLPWKASTAYEVNDYVKPSDSSLFLNWAFQCTTAGTSGTSEPTFPGADGNTVGDGTVTWTTRAFDYTYEVLSGTAGLHEMHKWVDVRKVNMPNYISVRNHPDDDLPHFFGFKEDTDVTDLTDMEKRFHYLLPVTSLEQANRIAEAYLEQAKRDAQTGRIQVPMNIGQEVHDYIQASDHRHGSADRLRGNITSLRRVVGGGEWKMEIVFGKTASVQLLGAFQRPGELAFKEVESAQEGVLDPATIRALSLLQDDMITNFIILQEGMIQNEIVLRTEINEIVNSLDERLADLERKVAFLLSEQLATSSAQGEITNASINARYRFQMPVGNKKFG